MFVADRSAIIALDRLGRAIYKLKNWTLMWIESKHVTIGSPLPTNSEGNAWPSEPNPIRICGERGARESGVSIHLINPSVIESQVPSDSRRHKTKFLPFRSSTRFCYSQKRELNFFLDRKKTNASNFASIANRRRLLLFLFHERIARRAS